jgi:hypothetical protein
MLVPSVGLSLAPERCCYFRKECTGFLACTFITPSACMSEAMWDGLQWRIMLNKMDWLEVRRCSYCNLHWTKCWLMLEKCFDKIIEFRVMVEVQYARDAAFTLMKAYNSLWTLLVFQIGQEVAFLSFTVLGRIPCIYFWNPYDIVRLLTQ